MKVRKKQIVDAEQWWDLEDLPGIVRPWGVGLEYIDCLDCGLSLAGHGKLGDKKVHPGDWIFTDDGVILRDEAFRELYEPAEVNDG